MKFWKAEAKELVAKYFSSLRGMVSSVTYQENQLSYITRVRVTGKKYGAWIENHNTWGFIFGDNVARTGKGGQAIIRDYKNALGICTKIAPSTNSSSYFSDEYFNQWLLHIINDIDAIVYSSYMHIFFPSGGIGTGLADMERKAPKLWAEMNDMLDTKLNIVRTSEGKYINEDLTTPLMNLIDQIHIAYGGDNYTIDILNRRLTIDGNKPIKI